MGGKNSKIQAYGQTVRKQVEDDVKRWKQKLQSLKNSLKIEEKKTQKITRSYAYELVEMLNNGQTTSLEIFTVLAQRCVTIGYSHHLITQIDFDAAHRYAEECDQLRKQSHKKNWTFKDQWDSEKYLPPLFGIPTSVKDYMDQKGKRSTLGATVRAHDIKDKDSGIVACLRSGGIIPFVRSNVAQTTMTFDPNNRLFGQAIGVWDRKRSVGGSSGGQGGLLAAFCTPIGLGTDIGGSLRIPAQFNGVVSLKPCLQRFSPSRQYTTDIPDLLYGNDTVISVFGPLARSVEDIALWMKTTCDQRHHNEPDPYHKMVDFKVQNYLNHSKKKLRIGIVRQYDFLEPTPASKRALQEVKVFLKKQGHELVEIDYPPFEEIIIEYQKYFFAQGNFGALEQILQGEDPIPSFEPTKKLLQSKWYYRYLACLTSMLAPRIYQTSVKTFKQMDVAQYCTHRSKVDKLRRSFCTWWKSMGLDHIITPGYGCQANITEMTGSIFLTFVYTCVWNLLSIPAGAMPITVVKQDQQHYQSSHNDAITECLKVTAAGSVGLPVGIQVIGMPFQQQKVLSLMKQIQNNFKFQQHRKVIGEQ